MTTSIARKLRRELATTLTRLRVVEVQPGDSASLNGENPADLFENAQAAEQRELGQLAATRLVDRARRLRVALARAERGEYGICEECGEDIAYQRLAALPDVVTCLACQETRERSPHLLVSPHQS